MEELRFFDKYECIIKANSQGIHHKFSEEVECIAWDNIEKMEVKRWHARRGRNVGHMLILHLKEKQKIVSAYQERYVSERTIYMRGIRHYKIEDVVSKINEMHSFYTGLPVDAKLTREAIVKKKRGYNSLTFAVGPVWVIATLLSIVFGPSSLWLFVLFAGFLLYIIARFI